MNWFIGTLFLLTLLFLWKNYNNKRRLKRLKKYFSETWGYPKKERHFNFYSIGQYFKNNFHKKDSFHIISDRTANDLDIDAVFKFIDRTVSKIGQQFLYYKLRTVQNIDSLNNFDTLTNLFATDKDLRLKCQLILYKISANSNYDFELLINKKPIEKPNYLKYIYGLSVLSVLAILLGFINPVFFLMLLPIFAVNIALHYKNKQNVNSYINAINQLNRSLSVGQQLAKFDKIKSHFKELSFLKKISKIKLKTEFVSIDRHIDNGFLMVLWYTVELIKIQFNLSTILFYSFIDSITKDIKSIDNLYQFIGKIESAISIASVKSGNLTICKPVFSKEKHINTIGIYHPLIENCVENSLVLDNKSLLLTGSNMSGKTTFIRTLAVNSILAQTLNFCFASKYNAPFLKVHSSIRITDDLLDDTSYYLKEVLTIKELIEASKDSHPCLFVLDEIFKGTNTIERISGGKAILSYLNKKQHIVVVSTHDIELTDLLKIDDFDLFHFTEKITNNELFFDHKLKKGKLTTRNAIKILELYNYPNDIINNAKLIEKKYFR